MSNLHAILNNFSPIKLNEMDEVALMERVDKKFIFEKSALLQILEDLLKNYSCLTINNNKLFSYQTEYFDDKKFSLFNNHHNGKLNRYKIRFRDYIQSEISFLEVKFKSNKGLTTKTRTAVPFQSRVSSKEFQEFISDQTPYRPFDLSSKLINNFDRITLVNLLSKERVTVDMNLNFKTNTNEIPLSDLCVMEVKKEKGSHQSEVLSLLKNKKIRPTSFSKYTIGSVLLNPQLKHNNFKKKLLFINKITRNGNVWNSTV
jgi:hypothetical protein